MFSSKEDKSTSSPADPQWFSLAQMQAAFAVTPQGFAKSIRPHIPAADVMNEGQRGKVRIRCRGAIDGVIKHRIEQIKHGEGDEMLAGDESPGLERYRLAKAELAEMDLQRQRGTHVDLRKLEPLLLRASGILRSAIEDVQRQYGNGPRDILSEALAETDAGWLKACQIPDRTEAA
jgi:hypothetical protein